MNLNTVAALLNHPSPLNGVLSGICTDSRLVQPGNLFIALQGDKFDGHRFLSEVADKGALAAVVSQSDSTVSMPQIVVPDTLLALATIATAHRQELTCPVIALTGSNGKTTVKEMIATILPQPSHATHGNLNNHIGAPMSVLGLKQEHRYAVFELGANHLGEIAYTAAVVRPDVALINNIAPAHVAGFGSIDGVANAKGEIYQSLHAGGTAVINDDDVYAHFWDDLLDNKKVCRFSATHQADVYARNIQLNDQGCGCFTLITPQGQIEITLQVPGMHNVRNALAASACCDAIGLSLLQIQKGLQQFKGVKGRVNVLTGINHSVIIDDTYNANLRSVLAGLEVLATRPGDKIFVFGDMGELGEWALQHHQEVGLAARRLDISQVLTCGEYSKEASNAFGQGGQHFANQADLVSFLIKELNASTVVLVKGSRSSAMENVVHKLLA